MRAPRRADAEGRYRAILRALETIERVASSGCAIDESARFPRDGDLAAVQFWISTLGDPRLVRDVLERRIRDATAARRHDEADLYARHGRVLEEMGSAGLKEADV